MSRSKSRLDVLDLECGHRRYVTVARTSQHAARATCAACNGLVDVVAAREAVIGVDVHARGCVDDEGRIECGCGLEDHLADLHEVERRRLDEVADA